MPTAVEVDHAASAAAAVEAVRRTNPRVDAAVLPTLAGVSEWHRRRAAE